METPEPFRMLPEFGPNYALWIYPMIFNARIVIGVINSTQVDNAWCYHTTEAAEAAALAWDPNEDSEPRGWHKNPIDGRRWRWVDDPEVPCIYCVQWEAEYPGGPERPVGPEGPLVEVRARSATPARWRSKNSHSADLSMTRRTVPTC